MTKTNKEKFAKQYGWIKIHGKKVNHEGFDNEYYDHKYDETLWTIEELSNYVTDCTFWQDTNSNRVTEDIDEVLKWIEKDHNVVFIEEKGDKNR